MAPAMAAMVSTSPNKHPSNRVSDARIEIQCYRPEGFVTTAMLARGGVARGPRARDARSGLQWI